MDTSYAPTIISSYFIEESGAIRAYYCPSCKDFTARWHKNNYTCAPHDGVWNANHTGLSCYSPVEFTESEMQLPTYHDALIAAIERKNYRELTLCEKIRKLCANFTIKI